MQVIEVNHKTVANLLKKSVEEYWLDDDDAWITFTDGSAVCVHLLENTFYAYVSLDDREENNNPRLNFTDDQSVYYFTEGGRDEYSLTARTVSLDFDRVRYYYHRQFDEVTRQYIPVIELHYYEKGEEIGNHS